MRVDVLKMTGLDKPATCSGCGMVVEGGAAGCRAIFEEVSARAFSNAVYGGPHRMMVDAYCVQHPDAYCASAKSLVAHFGGLCVGFEYDGAPVIYKALLRWLDGPPFIPKPVIPYFRGALTIAEVHRELNPATYGQGVERWARCAWEAYAALHPLARRWIHDAVEAGARRHKKR
jgi:hypothetical protein